MAQGRPASPSPRNRSQRPSETLTGASVAAPALWSADEYCPRTLAWWDVWANSPQAESFLASDWVRLQMLAQVVDQFFMTGDKNLLAEIRLNEEKLGATVRDRQNLRMVFKEDKPEEKVEESRETENVIRLKTAFGKRAA